MQEPCATELSKTITSPFLCANGEPDKVKQMSVIGEKGSSLYPRIPPYAKASLLLYAAICTSLSTQTMLINSVFLADKLYNAPSRGNPPLFIKILLEL